MTKKEKILQNINADKQLCKAIGPHTYYDANDFYNAAVRYVKATKDRRMCCSIASVSYSGMSRTMRFVELSKSRGKGYQVLNFWMLFKCLGFTPARSNDGYFSISGCGMDMVFNTHYEIVRELYRLGFLTKAQCQDLEQITPHVI